MRTGNVGYVPLRAAELRDLLDKADAAEGLAEALESFRDGNDCFPYCEFIHGLDERHTAKCQVAHAALANYRAQEPDRAQEAQDA